MEQQIIEKLNKAKSIIYNLRYLFVNQSNKLIIEKAGINGNVIIDLLMILENQILVPNKFIFNDKFLNIIYDELPVIINSINKNLYEYQNDNVNFGTKSIVELQNTCQRLLSILEALVNKKITSNQSYNSESFYKQQIIELKKSKDKLEAQLKELQITKRQLSEESLDQKSELQQKENEVSQIKFKLEETLSLLKKAEEELEAKQKQDDAQKNWSKKIELTFENLSCLLEPIKKEYTRLSYLYYVYMGLAGGIIILLIILEIILCTALAREDSSPQFLTYLPYYIPIPIAGALLWAFIVQMNRAQRQLIILAERIHHIKYIEGLLLSLNTLAPNIDDAVKRINRAVDKLIEGHLANNESFFSEEQIIKEEKKDSLPIDIVIKLIDTIKGTSQ